MAKVQPDVIGTDDAQAPAVEAGKLNVCMCSEATQAKVVAFFDHTYTSIAMGIFTIYSLIGDDLLHLSRGAGPDVTHQWLCLFMFIAFGAEWVSFCFCKPKFMWSFFFYLDFVATV